MAVRNMFRQKKFSLIEFSDNIPGLVLSVVLADICSQVFRIRKDFLFPEQIDYADYILLADSEMVTDVVYSGLGFFSLSLF